MARSDLVLAVPVALADPGPRAGGARAGYGGRRRGGDDLAIRVGLALLAVAIAAATWALVEEPFRRGRLVLRGRGRGFALAGATALVLVLGSTAVGVVGDREVAAAAALDAGAASTDDEVSPTAPDDPAASRSTASWPSTEPERRAPAVDAGSDGSPRAVPDRLHATVDRAASESPDRRRSAS